MSPEENAYVYGIENSVHIEASEQLDLRLTLTLQDSDDGSDRDREITQVPRVQASVLGTWYQDIADRPGWLTVGIDYLGDRFQNRTNSRELSAITNVRAVVGYEPTDHLTVTLRGENLTNELDYQHRVVK